MISSNRALPRGALLPRGRDGRAEQPTPAGPRAIAKETVRDSSPPSLDHHFGSRPATYSPTPPDASPAPRSANGSASIPAVRAGLVARTDDEVLNAQKSVERHLRGRYGPELAQRVAEAIAATGTRPGIAHPVAADVRLDPRVAAKLEALLATPGSGVALDAHGMPRLSDPTKAADILVQLAEALPAGADSSDCALLIDGSNSDRISFGVGRGHYVDAVSAAIMFAGSARMIAHADPDTPDFLHSKSAIWTLQKKSIGLAACQWADMREVHYLVELRDDLPPSTAFADGKYKLFKPSDPEHQKIPGFAELEAAAQRIVEGRGQGGGAAAQKGTAADPGIEGIEKKEDASAGASSTAMRWPKQGSLLLDRAILRAAEAFVRNLGGQGRISDGHMFIGGKGSGLGEEDALAICADLSLVLSAVARTDSGQDAGGPFGTVVWNPESGALTVGKNQVVPSKAAVNHGERVGLFLHGAQDRAWLVTSAEPCVMCYLACEARDMDIAFVATSRTVEANTPFQEGKKNWAEFQNRVLGPEVYTGPDGKAVVEARAFLSERQAVAEKVLAAWTKNGQNYAP